MTLPAYGVHVCPHDGQALVPCSYTHDLYECTRCHSFFVGEALTNEYHTTDKLPSLHFNSK